MIECSTITGEKILVPKEKLTLRISAYGVIRNGVQVLVQEMLNNDKYFFPGGEVETGETLEEAVKREIAEEVGMEVDVQKLLHATQSFFYYEPLDNAWQSYLFFFECKPITFKIKNADQIIDDEAKGSLWKDIKNLSKSDFKDPADEVFDFFLKS